MLSIQDGPSRRDVTLDGAQIRSSSVLYSPSSDNVSIQLAVTTPLSTVTESFLLLLPENRIPQPAVPGEAKAPALRPVRLKPFTPPTVAAGSSTQPATPVLPLVSLQPGGAVDPGSLSTLIAPSPLPAPPPESPGANAAAPAPATYHMAEPRNRVVPQIPPALLNTLVLPATVQVRVSIDRDGR